MSFLIFIIIIDDDPVAAFSRINQTLIQPYGGLIIFIYILLSIVWIIPSTILAIYYTRTMEFRIEANEVILKKGIINKTVKHIPFRNITNVASRYGIYDRLLKIGNVEIETASAASQATGPEAKIEGIRNFNEIRDQILTSIRKFATPYTTTTEVETPPTEVNSDLEFYQKLLLTLDDIKKILDK